MAPSHKAFQAWSRANAEATAAEKKVQQQALDFASGRAGPPSEDDLRDAFMKRLAATQAFADVLASQAEIARQFQVEKDAAAEARGRARSDDSSGAQA